MKRAIRTFHKRGYAFWDNELLSAKEDLARVFDRQAIELVEAQIAEERKYTEKKVTTHKTKADKPSLSFERKTDTVWFKAREAFCSGEHR